MMKSTGVLWLMVVLAAAVAAQNKYPGGIVYGPKAAFNISAPDGWVLDNESACHRASRACFIQKGSRGPMPER